VLLPPVCDLSPVLASVSPPSLPVLHQVLGLAVDPEAIRATAEEIRTVAKEARMVVEEAYDTEMLDAFSDALTPVFMRALPPKPPGQPTLVETNVN